MKMLALLGFQLCYLPMIHEINGQITQKLKDLNLKYLWQSLDIFYRMFSFFKLFYMAIRYRQYILDMYWNIKRVLIRSAPKPYAAFPPSNDALFKN